MHVILMAYCTPGVMQTSLHHELVLTNRHKTGREEECRFSGVPIHRIVDRSYSFTQEK